MNIAALLEFDPAEDLSLDKLTALLDERIPRVRRLRQRLWAPRGCGAPVWVDDAEFDLARHLGTVNWPAAGDPRSLLDLAADLACRRLPRDRPLWRGQAVVRSDGRVVGLVLIRPAAATD
jgi:hypothetical protein